MCAREVDNIRVYLYICSTRIRVHMCVRSVRSYVSMRASCELLYTCHTDSRASLHAPADTISILENYNTAIIPHYSRVAGLFFLISTSDRARVIKCQCVCLRF